MKIAKLTAAAAVLAACAGAVVQADAENMVFYRSGTAVKIVPTDRTDHLNILEPNKIHLVDETRQIIQTIPGEGIDSVVFDDVMPLADLLDVEFKADGTAEDVSPMHHDIQCNNTRTVYNNSLGRYVASFDNPWAGTATQWYSVDYTDNKAFKDALAAGHSIEAVIKANYGTTLANSEVKPFSSHQNGGTGIMICKTGNGGGRNALTFLPNVSSKGSSNWCWATSNVKPADQAYYHIVGVYDKEKGVSRIYVNGVLEGEVASPGDFIFPITGCTRFTIGGDPNTNNAVEQAWNGDVAVARIYSKPLETKEVEALYRGVEHGVQGLNTPLLPKADLLDVEFGADGTASDISPLHSTVERGTTSTYYSPEFGRYVAQFTNEWGGSNVSEWYRVDYTNNTTIRNGLADGHTMEAVIMANYISPMADAEIKPFSSHQGGGTGFLICKTANGGGKNVLTFLPNVSTDGKSTWRWATSTTVPSPKAFYHIVGVYDKASAKCHIYVNGRLQGSADAAGSLVFPTSGCTKFTIGGDPAANNAVSHGWRGDIAVARIYDKPLSEENVYLLYRDVHKGVSTYSVPISNEFVLSDIAVKAGARMPVWGHGWKEGDVIQLRNSSGTVVTVPTTIEADRGVATLPSGLATGKYDILVKRGDIVQKLGTSSFTVTTTLPRGCKVIAHRGHWKPAGSAHNSRSSLRNAIALGVYGSECDVWCTTDKASVCYHDEKIDNVSIYQNAYSAVRNKTISNGELLPALNEFLDIIKSDENTSDVKLIIEIKTHNTTAKTQAAAAEVIKCVKAKKVEAQVAFIAFDYGTCQYIANQKYPVQYLGGDKAPSNLSAGISIDYKLDKLKANPAWIKQAHDKGLEVNGWTINTSDEIGWFNRQDADYITTDIPDIALKYYEYYQMNR